MVNHISFFTSMVAADNYSYHLWWWWYISQSDRQGKRADSSSCVL